MREVIGSLAQYEGDEGNAIALALKPTRLPVKEAVRKISSYDRNL
jgi:hypothetical protein